MLSPPLFLTPFLSSTAHFPLSLLLCHHLLRKRVETGLQESPHFLV